MQTIQLGIYEHYKGGHYEVVGVGQLHAAGNTLEPVVIYRSLEDAPDYPAGSWWARPVKEFISMVELAGQQVPRFTYLETKITP